MFFDRLKKLCDEKGISTYKACTDVGLNRAAVAKWKKGSVPGGSTAAKLADYFGVTTDYLLGKGEQKKSALNEVYSVPTSMADRIKELRKQKGLTLEQVAGIVGVGKSTVRKWETGMIANMRRDKIAYLAKALGTTPAYLMGWTDEKELSPSEENLTEGEQKLLSLFRQVPADQQELVLQMIRAALGKM